MMMAVCCRQAPKPWVVVLGLFLLIGLKTSDATNIESILPKIQTRFNPFPSIAELERKQLPSSSAKVIALHNESNEVSFSTSFRGGGHGSSDTAVVEKFLPPGFTLQNIAGALAFILLDKFFSKAFQSANIRFPAQLGGCMILFGIMAMIPPLGQYIYQALNPGAELMAKWIGVCLIGGVVTLPTAPSIGGFMDLIKMIVVVLGGAYFTCFSTAFSVLGLRTLLGSIALPSSPATAGKNKNIKKQEVAIPTAVLPSPFSAELLQGMIPVTSFLFGLVNVLTKNEAAHEFLPLLNSIYLTLSTVAAFVWSVRLPASFNQKFHPIFTSTLIVWGLFQIIALLTGNEFLEALATYKNGTTGAGDILLGLLSPCVISFSTALYNRRQSLLDNFLVVVTGALVSSFGTLFGTAALVRVMSLGGSNGSLARLSTLARNVVAPLAVVICNMLGGDTSIQVAIVVLTGVLGATFARSWLDAANIQDPVTRGMGVGGCGLSLAVASMAPEPEAFPFAILAFILNAVFATIAVTSPSLREALVQLATGGGE